MPSKNSLLRELRRRYIESRELPAMLQAEGIRIIGEFTSNWRTIERFHEEYYCDGYPRTVICGLNPGQHGAGKTGLPFVDFSSLSKLLSGVTRSDTERTAQFFFEIVSHFGAKAFYRSFYVTNVSWVGFLNGKCNVNYDKLPAEAIQFVSRQFEYEMSVVKPIRVISLSKPTHATVSRLMGNHVDTSFVLPHPNWCAFPNNSESSRTTYIKTLTPFLRR
jgi:hypothetical protein